jgi:formylmethanofuran dehydrogenase subunit E
MKNHLPRCDLSKKKNQRHGPAPLKMPPIRLGDPCIRCGERSVYCTHKRHDSRYLCENCYRKRLATTITKKKKWLWDHKEAVGCVTCGESNPKCLDYHHLYPDKKKFSIGSVPSSIPTYAIIIEMKKCVVLCANCHRKVEAATKQQL